MYLGTETTDVTCARERVSTLRTNGQAGGGGGGDKLKGRILMDRPAPSLAWLPPGGQGGTRGRMAVLNVSAAPPPPLPTFKKKQFSSLKKLLFAYCCVPVTMTDSDYKDF